MPKGKTPNIITRKEEKKLPYYTTVTANCYTQEEALVMIDLIVICQHHYRKLKKERQPRTILKVLSAARPDLIREDKRRRHSQIPK